jgi:hypothetical protein
VQKTSTLKQAVVAKANATIEGTLEVQQTSTLKEAVIAKKNATIEGTLEVQQTSTLKGNVGIVGTLKVGHGATGPEAKLDVNGDMIVRGTTKGSYSDPANRRATFGPLSAYWYGWVPDHALDWFPLARAGLQQATVMQGFSTTTAPETQHPPHQFALAYSGSGTYQNSAHR